MNNITTRIINSYYIEYIILSILLLIFVITRLYKINNPVADWHSWRQADTASVTKTFLDRGIDLIFPRYHDISTIQTGKFNSEGYRFVEFPIYNAIHAVLVNNFSFFTLEVWGRILSIMSALISAVFIFLLGKRFLGRWGGILACLFYALIPFNIYFTRVILPEPLAVAFAITSLWVFVRFIDTGKLSGLYLSGILFALGLLVKPFVIFYGVPMIYLALEKYTLRKIFTEGKLLIPFLLFLDIVLIPLILWRGWMVRYPEGIPHFTWVFNGDGIRFRPSFWRWIFGERIGHLILGSWGLLPFSLGIIHRKNNFYFTQFFLLGMLIYLSVIATANVRHDYYQTLIIPAISLVLAQGSLWMWKSENLNKLLSRFILIFSLGVGLITGALQVKEFYNINHPEILTAGAAADKLVAKDALIIAPYNGDTAFLYQTKRWGWPFVDLPIDELIAKGADYYVAVNFDSQTTEFIQKFEAVQRTDQYVILDLHKRK